MSDFPPVDATPQLPAEVGNGPAANIGDLLHPKRELAPSLRIMLDEHLYGQVKRLAGIMSMDTVFTPAHLRGKAAACFTVITQAINWNMDPSFVARSTYQTPGGSIGFEGKLVQAILEQSGQFIGAPKAIYVGDWNKLTGKFEKLRSQKGNEYVKSTWTEADAEGLGIIISWQVRGEDEPRVWPGEDQPFYLTQCFPLNSPLWGTDPRTQIRYLAMRRFATGVAPGILGGMPFDHDELLDASELAKDVTPPTARPTRENFKDPAELVNDSTRDTQLPYEVVDLAGIIATHETADAAVEAYRAAIKGGLSQRGEAGLTLVWDNNQPLMRQLDERGFAAVTKELSEEYGVLRQAAAARGAPASETGSAEESEQPKADTGKADPDPGAAESNTTRPAASQGKLGLSIPTGERDPEFWGAPKWVIYASADDELSIYGVFMRDLPKRLAEARTWDEVSKLEHDNAATIRRLPADDRSKMSGWIAERREQVRDA